MQFVVLLCLFLISSGQTLKTIDNAQELSDFTLASPFNVIVFVNKNRCLNEHDENCRQQRDTLEQIHQLCTNERIELVLSTNSQFAEKKFNLYGIEPKLCFFREGFPIVYPDSINNIDRLQEWFTETRERLTRTLDDRSFEHDTQAATGSTTGDWFILFKKSNDSRGLIPVWELTSLHFRNRIIFAYVDVDKNPVIQKRFHIFNLPTFILFKRGKMYRYESSSWKQTSFIDFLDNTYEKVKGEVVPPEPSVFLTYFENFPKPIPIYLVIIPMICLLAVLLFLVSGLTKKKKTNTDRASIQVKID